MASSLFKPNVSSSGLGKKAEERGQFVNPPAYPETSGFTGSSKTAAKNIGVVQRSPTAKGGKV